MAYIVPREIPKSCAKCFFHGLKFSYPSWAKEEKELCNKQGLYCQLDEQKPKRVMVVDFGDKTSKAEWCPLKEMVGDDK